MGISSRRPIRSIAATPASGGGGHEGGGRRGSVGSFRCPSHSRAPPALARDGEGIETAAPPSSPQYTPDMRKCSVTTASYACRFRARAPTYAACLSTSNSARAGCDMAAIWVPQATTGC